MQTCGEEIAHLGRLRDELNQDGLNAQLAVRGKMPFLKVANLDTPDLNERVFCRAADDQAACFLCPWRQPIGSVDAIATRLDDVRPDPGRLKRPASWLGAT